MPDTIDQSNSNSLVTMKNLWMRTYFIRFSNDSDSEVVVLTNKDLSNNSVYSKDVTSDWIVSNNKYKKFEYDIKISGVKKMSSLADNGVIEIKNVENDLIAMIMAKKLYDIEIIVGYKDQGDVTLCKGAVAYISNTLNERKTTVTKIYYSSQYVAAFSQKRMNFTFNSNTNIYDMIKTIVGENNCKLSDKLKEIVIEEVSNSNGETITVIDNIINEKGADLIIQTDSIEGNIITIDNVDQSKKIAIDSNTVNFINGNPTISSDGLNMDLFVSFNLMPGMILNLDDTLKSKIDLSSGMGSLSSVQDTFNSNYLDPSGDYLVEEINYTFENRGDSFKYSIKAISLNVYKRMLEGE